MDSSLIPQLRTHILASTDPAVVAARDARNDTELARLYNLPSSFIVWRTNVSREDVYTGNPQPANSFWNWTTYKNQAVAEQNAWTQMFMGDRANFSFANVRSGVSAIFTGSAQANAQRDHVLEVAKRAARVVEAIYATGTGTTVSPGVLAFEGQVTTSDIGAALNG